MGKQWNSNEDALQMAKQNFERSEKYRLALEVVTAERDALKAQLADAAKVSDGVWEWVPKPKYDALLEKIERALEIIKDLAALHDSYIGYLSVHNNYNEPAAKAISERITALRNDVVPLKNVAPAVGEEQTSRLREFIGNTVSERFTKDFVREGVLAILELTAAPLHDTKEKE